MKCSDGGECGAGGYCDNCPATKSKIMSGGHVVKTEELHDKLVFVGYTNGAQILYANDENQGGEGSFYKTTDHDCWIPLYMLKTHVHRLETGFAGVTLETIKAAQRA